VIVIESYTADHFEKMNCDLKSPKMDIGISGLYYTPITDRTVNTTAQLK
jgi:hypothetical protein